MKLENRCRGFLVALIFLVFGGPGLSAAVTDQRGVAEINEGTVRQVFVGKPLVGAMGHVIFDLGDGQVRVEVKNFPASEKGYEAFLFGIDVSKYQRAMFVGGDPQKGVRKDHAPFGEVGKLIYRWHSIGGFQVDERGNGTLVY